RPVNGVLRGRPARPRSVPGVSWRSWQAVTAMRRPGREGVGGQLAQGRHIAGGGGGETSRTPRFRPTSLTPPCRLCTWAPYRGVNRPCVPGGDAEPSRPPTGDLSTPWCSQIASRPEPCLGTVTTPASLLKRRDVPPVSVTNPRRLPYLGHFGGGL